MEFLFSKLLFSRREYLKFLERQEIDSIREAQRQKRKKKHVAKRKGQVDHRTNRPGKRK